MEFKAAVFDLDGTLLDTLEDLADAVNVVLERRGHPVHPVEAYKYFVGDGPPVLLDRALPREYADDADYAAQCVKEYKEEYSKRWDAKSKPYPGMAALLDGLVARGMKLSVLSNKPHEFTAECVHGMLGDWEWESLLGMRDGVPRKPDPAGAFETAEALGVKPEECAYFGDTATDMETARGAGMFAVGCLWGFRDEAELTGAGAKVVIARPEEFLEKVLGG